MYPGFPSRLEKEMKQLYMTKVLGGDGSRLKVSSLTTMRRCKMMEADSFRISRLELKILLDVNIWFSWVELYLQIS